MQVAVAEQAIIDIGCLDFEVVERKGIGHPDTMADLVAEDISQRYSRLGLTC